MEKKSICTFKSSDKFQTFEGDKCILVQLEVGGQQFVHTAQNMTDECALCNYSLLSRSLGLEIGMLCVTRVLIGLQRNQLYIET